MWDTNEISDLLDLQLFADAGGEGASGGNGSDAGSQDTGAGPQDAAGAEAPTGGAGKKLSFDELLKDPEYKAAYDAKFRKGLDGRFRDHKALQDRQAQMAPMLELLCGKYGVQYSPDMDPAELIAAVSADNSYYEAEAEQRGMSVEALKSVKRMEAENARFHQAEEQRKRDEQWNNVVRQAEAAKAKFPGLDLEAEMQNPAFGRMVANGVPVEAAYKAIHMDEIMSAGMGYAVRQTQQQTVNSIASGQNRPRENGMGGKPAAAQPSIDPRNLTKEQREDIIARARRGEKISL